MRWQEEFELVESHESAYGYNWSAIGVFRRKTDGKLFWATDGGCSCNSAWGDTHLDVEPLTWESLGAFSEEAMNIVQYGDESAMTNTEAHEWVAKISRLVQR